MRGCLHDNHMGEIGLEMHIFPILMRTVKFEDRQCTEDCTERQNCPIMIEIQRQEDDADELQA